MVEKDNMAAMMAMFEGDNPTTEKKKLGRPALLDRRRSYSISMDAPTRQALNEFEASFGAKGTSDTVRILVADRQREENLPRSVRELIASLREVGGQSHSPHLLQAIIDEKIDNYRKMSK